MKLSIGKQSVFSTGLFIATSALACSESSVDEPIPDQPPSADAGARADVGVGDASVVPDADCPTCDWFPAQCSRGALCAVNATIEPKTVLLALAPHGERMTAVGTFGAVVDLVADQWQNASVGTRDALRAASPHGGEIWAASSLDAVFVRPLGESGAALTHLSTRGGGYFSGNRPINGLFGDPRRTWAWAAITPVCAGGFNGDGVALVRLRREPTRLEVEDVIKHDGFTSKCAGLNAVDGTGDEVWAAGDLGTLYKLTDLDSAPPQVVAANSGTTASLLAVWAEPTGHVWASGRNGTLVHRAPGQPSALELVPTTAGLHAVRGTSPSDVWAVGEDATVLHFDGKTWSRVPVAGLGDRRPTLRAIAAVASGRVWVAGDGVLLTLAGDDERTP